MPDNADEYFSTENIQARMQNDADRISMERMQQGNNGGGDWHIDAWCEQLGFTKEDANIIKCEYDSFFQELFGGQPTSNTPKQYESLRKSVRRGDPKGVLGVLFKTVRTIYFALEKVPVANNLKLWAQIDCLVLSKSKNLVVKQYREALKKNVSLRFAH